MSSRIAGALLLLVCSSAGAAEKSPSVAVDANGVMRWRTSGQEVALFGVNYTAPFAHAFRAHARLGIPIEQAIDADVYHFARLGFDAYRVHVWDREISDAQGNLVANEHVHALDYLLARLAQRGIRVILTPLQFGNAGHPEPGVPLEGFTSKYGKQGSLENQEAWPLQERYLAQFARHVNSLSGVAYRDDPNIIGFEICNEPGHFDYAPTVEYINRMVGALRGAGVRQPVFYNMSHGIPVHEAYLDADVQGGTFQWYPSNLVAGHEQRGNFLPYVDDYPIPFASEAKFRHKAKIAYEFDAADIGRGYLYPAMARTFRKAGMQFAAQFAYDPMYIAPFNTEYQTHYLNLAYAPQKALAMKIAGEAFRRVPRNADFGSYPQNARFAGVHISYEEDLAELVTSDTFFYSNTTTTRPPAPGKLSSIAGFGSSPLISYAGRGAYFLDSLSAGAWRLEVMPDAIWVRDPFEKPSPNKQVARIAWNEWPMHIDLPDLGSDFTAAGLNEGNQFRGTAQGGTLTVGPGVYLLTRRGGTAKWTADSHFRNITLKEFVAPLSSVDRVYVVHQPVVEATAGQDLEISAFIAAPRLPPKVSLIAYPPPPPAPPEPKEPVRTQPGGDNGPGLGRVDTGGARSFEMKSIGGFEYRALIPGDQLRRGTLRYEISVQHADGYTTFPSNLPGLPTDWDFYGKPWQARIVAKGAPLLIFDAAVDAEQITADHRGVVYERVPSDRPGTTAIDVVAPEVADGEHDHSLRFFFKDKIAGRTSELGAVDRIVLYGRSAAGKACPVQVSLVSAEGVAYGGVMSLQDTFGAYALPVAALQAVRAPNIPHGYPVFIHFWNTVDAHLPLDLKRVESVLVSVGPGIASGEYAEPHEIEIERIWLDHS
ncbi:MAG TPA: hypothetical protein VKB41_16695 [Steroidobacteraceae bacterium]|nr:hypothetical protein [Steroidobacteraceae bacterium]